METYVQGVKIVLTAEQQAAVEKELKARAKYKDNFEKLLKRFKFKRIDTSTWEYNKDTVAFEHVYFEWYAEIKGEDYKTHVFMAGTGLKHASTPPCGWEYYTPKEVEEELTKFLDNYNGE